MIPKIIISLIEYERIRQDMKWGGASHDDEHSVHDWVGFIKSQLDRLEPGANRKNAYVTFIKIAALSIAALESMDRTK